MINLFTLERPNRQLSEIPNPLNRKNILPNNLLDLLLALSLDDHDCSILGDLLAFGAVISKGAAEEGDAAGFDQGSCVLVVRLEEDLSLGQDVRKIRDYDEVFFELGGHDGQW